MAFSKNMTSMLAATHLDHLKGNANTFSDFWDKTDPAGLDAQTKKTLARHYRQLGQYLSETAPLALQYTEVTQIAARARQAVHKNARKAGLN
jgi:hypothetical protein